jgi:hypothetical protein
VRGMAAVRTGRWMARGSLTSDTQDAIALPASATTVVYTDGACSGNPGPGGWAWAVPQGRYASGAKRHS